MHGAFLHRYHRLSVWTVSRWGRRRRRRISRRQIPLWLTTWMTFHRIPCLNRLFWLLHVAWHLQNTLQDYKNKNKIHVEVHVHLQRTEYQPSTSRVEVGVETPYLTFASLCLLFHNSQPSFYRSVSGFQFPLCLIFSIQTVCEECTRLPAWDDAYGSSYIRKHRLRFANVSW